MSDIINYGMDLDTGILTGMDTGGGAYGVVDGDTVRRGSRLTRLDGFDTFESQDSKKSDILEYQYGISKQLQKKLGEQDKDTLLAKLTQDDYDSMVNKGTGVYGRNIGNIQGIK